MSPAVSDILENHSRFPVSVSHAHYCLGDYKEAATSFKRGLRVEPESSSLTSALANAEARLNEAEPPSDTQTVPSAQPGEGGQTPDLSELLNNPMMRQMAQQLTANGGLEKLMQNPSVANMVGYLSSGRSSSRDDFTPWAISDPIFSDESNAVRRRHAFNVRANV